MGGHVPWSLERDLFWSCASSSPDSAPTGTEFPDRITVPRGSSGRVGQPEPSATASYIRLRSRAGAERGRAPKRGCEGCGRPGTAASSCFDAIVCSLSDAVLIRDWVHPLLPMRTRRRSTYPGLRERGRNCRRRRRRRSWPMIWSGQPKMVDEVTMESTPSAADPPWRDLFGLSGSGRCIARPVSSIGYCGRPCLLSSTTPERSRRRS